MNSLVVTLAAAIVVGFSTITLLPASADAAEPPGYSGETPEITGGPYATYQTVRVFEAPLMPLRQWIDEGGRIVAAMEETDNIKKPVASVTLHGTWPETGSVRRLEMSDGNFVLEKVLENDFPDLFRYQVWNFTAPAGRNIAYAIAQQEWTTLEDGRSELTWTYSLRPRLALMQPFVQRFVRNDMQPLMNDALDVVREQAGAVFGPGTLATQ